MLNWRRLPGGLRSEYPHYETVIKDFWQELMNVLPSVASFYDIQTDDRQFAGLNATATYRVNPSLLIDLAVRFRQRNCRGPEWFLCLTVWREPSDDLSPPERFTVHQQSLEYWLMPHVHGLSAALNKDAALGLAVVAIEARPRIHKLALLALLSKNQ
jgi:hypothetical protein